MATGGTRRGTLRAGAAAVLGLLVVVGGWALQPSRAAADPAVTVYIRDLTPPVVSVDRGGSVTFVNQIADKALSAGLGPLAVTAVVHTDVTVNLPSGSHTIQPSTQPVPDQPPPQLAPDQSWTEKFAQTCATCTITYTYRVDGAQLTQVLDLLPPLPLPTPFVVNTLLPLPNLPGVNLPPLPKVNVPLPSQLPLPGRSAPLPQQQTVTTTTTTVTTTTTRQGIAGTPFSYDLSGLGMAPQGAGVVPAFDPSRLPGASGGSSTSPAEQPNGLGNPQLASESASGPAPYRELSWPALIALVAVAGAGTGLVRTWSAR